MIRETKIMGILNVTPDSFSDGGKFAHVDKAIEHGQKMISEGAHIIDIGGESTRPGADIIDPKIELGRVLPVIEGLKNAGALLSIDTRNASTMDAAIKAGAGMINDISALTHDPQSMEVAAASGAYIVLMHMQGTPQNMQENPSYDNVTQEVYNYLQSRITACEIAGISRQALIIDPGFGFGKTFEHNMELLENLDQFQNLRAPIMVGLSRKSFIEKITGEQDPENRLPGSLAVATFAYMKGAQIFRVHDVAPTIEALELMKELP